MQNNVLLFKNNPSKMFFSLIELILFFPDYFLYWFFVILDWSTCEMAARLIAMMKYHAQNQLQRTSCILFDMNSNVIICWLPLSQSCLQRDSALIIYDFLKVHTQFCCTPTKHQNQHPNKKRPLLKQKSSSDFESLTLDKFQLWAKKGMFPKN